MCYKCDGINGEFGVRYGSESYKCDCINGESVHVKGHGVINVMV